MVDWRAAASSSVIIIGQFVFENFKHLTKIKIKKKKNVYSCHALWGLGIYQNYIEYDTQHSIKEKEARFSDHCTIILLWSLVFSSTVINIYSTRAPIILHLST